VPNVLVHVGYYCFLCILLAGVAFLGGETLSEKLASMTREFNKWCQSNKIRLDILKGA